VPAKVLLSLIYQYPERLYYDTWFFPAHKDLQKLLSLTDLEYNNILTKLVDAGLIKRKKDRQYKTHRMMYAINFDNLNRFEHGVPKDMVTI
jgi:predicted transcriptional regulator